MGFSSNLKSLRCCKLTNILSGEWIDVSQLLVTRGEAVLVESGRRWAIETNLPQNLQFRALERFTRGQTCQANSH